MARAKYKAELKVSRDAYENIKYSELADEGARNSKKWWSLLKQVHSTSDYCETMPPIDDGQNIITCDEQKAETFNNFFLQTSKLDDSNSRIPDNPIVGDAHKLNNVDIKAQDVMDQLNNLDANKAYGPDGVSPVFRKEGGGILIDVFHKLFKFSLAMGSFLHYGNLLMLFQYTRRTLFH